MAKMVSPAGEMEVRILEVNQNHNRLILTGQMGIWEAKIYLEPEEVVQTIRLMTKASVLQYLLKLPLVYLARLRKKDELV